MASSNILHINATEVNIVLKRSFYEGKKIRPDRNPARFKIQYPMKNQNINAGLLI